MNLEHIDKDVPDNNGTPYLIEGCMRIRNRYCKPHIEVVHGLEFVVKESQLFLADDDDDNLLQHIVFELTKNNESHILEGGMDIIVQYRGVPLLPGTLLKFTVK